MWRASNCLVIRRRGCSPSLAGTKCDTLCVLRNGTKKEAVRKIDRQGATDFAQHCSTSMDDNHTAPVKAHYFLSVHFMFFPFLLYFVIIFLYSSVLVFISLLPCYFVSFYSAVLLSLKSKCVYISLWKKKKKSYFC